MRHEDPPRPEPTAPGEVSSPASAAAPEVGPASAGRRRFLKAAALASTPVILTVASRPAWGYICAPSGVCSGNISDADPTVCLTGDGPNTWASRGVNSWPAPYNTNNIRFNDVFGAGPTQQLIQVLNGTGGGTYTDFERAAVAALLNAADGLMPYLANPVGCIIDIVHDVLANGTYEPGPGCTWDEAHALDYFEMTFATT